MLRTKVQIPPLRPNLVPRPRLIEQLNDGLQPGLKLTLVSTPAGYGKSTALMEWARASRLPIGWLSLEQADNDFERFFRYVAMAWETAQPGIRDTPFGMLLGASSPNKESVLTAFINLANALDVHIALILEDYHLIEEPTIHEALTFLLDHLPPQFHFVLTSRGEPPLPLARYRARNEMQEIRTEDLQFSLEEAAVFLNQFMSLNLAQNKVAALHKQSEGWIAGLHLAALTLRRDPDMSPDLISGKHRFIADYLSQEIVTQESAAVQHFLLQTSILDRLCGSLCEAVTGQQNGQEMLEYLERANLFLMPLDNGREWFRYHPIFASFLNEELQRHQPDEVTDLNGRAARWYLAHELPDPAFCHAVESNDVELVINIAERYVPPRVVGGEINAVQQWLHIIPDAWLADYPMFRLFQAAVYLATGQFEACVRCLDRAEQQARLKSENRHRLLAKATAFRCFIACFKNDLPRAETLADQALHDLPEDDTGFRPGVYGALGDTYRRHNRWQEAQVAYLKLLEFLEFTDIPAYRVQVVHANGALADLSLRQGRLQEAASYWQKALAAIQKPENWGSYPLPVIGWVYIRLGELLYEWNALTAAGDHVRQGLEYAELGGDVRGLIAGYLIAGRLKLTEGDTETTTAYLEKARPLLESAQFAHWLSRFERLQLELWLSQDKLRTAVKWADEKLLRVAGIEKQPESEVARLTIARVLIVKGDTAVGRALALLDQLLQESEQEGRMDITIEAQTIQAVARWKQGNQVAALTTLEHALRLAQPEGYVRLFADLGLPMARLLQEAHSRAVMPAYVSVLLDAFGVDTTVSEPTTLPEPLTPREQEVLELLAAGLTNHEIAEALVIAPGTVKKHTSNIYSKLNVSNRTEAAIKAREIDLLT